MQAIATHYDDCGSWIDYLQRGTPVRYEADIGNREIRATLHADVGGHEFVAAVEKWMRFTWRANLGASCP
jgi:hypothetical protein